MTSSSKKIDYQAFDDHSISYEYSVEWIFNCVTLWDRQNFQFPLNEDDLASARQLFVDDFKHCKFLLLTPDFFLQTTSFYRTIITNRKRR